MSDNVLYFPERRASIPVNDPDIPCERSASCSMCGANSFKLLATPDLGLTGLICNSCKFRSQLVNPTFIEPVDAEPA